MKKLIFMALVVGLAGCKFAPMTKVLSANEETVVVESIDDDAALAEQLASSECFKISRFARLISQRGNEYVFACVK